MRLIILQAIKYFACVLEALFFARVMFSFLPKFHRSGIYRVLHSLTEPILEPIRKIIDKSPIGGSGMPLDFSPLIALLLIELVRMFITMII